MLPEPGALSPGTPGSGWRAGWASEAAIVPIEPPFPELARAWYQAGPNGRGVLRTPDPLLAAEYFNWLVLAIPVNTAMSLPGDDHLHTTRELDRYADKAVRVFLAAYGPASASAHGPAWVRRGPRADRGRPQSGGVRGALSTPVEN